MTTTTLERPPVRRSHTTTSPTKRRSRDRTEHDSTRSKSQRRSRGTGRLFVRTDRNGKESYYGSWYVNGRRVKRRIGPKRARGEHVGLTVTQAEAELRRLIAETQVSAPVGERLSVSEVSRRYVIDAQRRGRKPATTENIESETRVHLAPFFGERSIDAISSEDVLDLIATLEGKGLAPKTIRNIIGTLSALLNFARKPQRRWATSNPCEGIELPATPESTEIRFLTMQEVRLVIAFSQPGIYQALDCLMWLMAAMTGQRKGELVAVRWRDIGWQAKRIRVRRNYTRKRFGTPKSRRSTRSVPMAGELADELARHHATTPWNKEDDLVFAHPETGQVQPKANITRRFRKALKAAKLDTTHRFHDLRHTYGTLMAAAGVPLRTLQEWMGHRDLTTTQIYADYAPSDHEGEIVEAAFASDQRGSVQGSKLSEAQETSEQPDSHQDRKYALA